MNVIGPDVSFYQDDPNTIRQIDFVAMKAAGAEFVIIRAGQNTWIDSDFIYNWQKAKEAGLPRGTYWFFDSRSSPTQQAELWSAAVGSNLPECGVWMDFEEKYGGDHSGEKYFKDFAAHVGTEFPDSMVGVYTGYYYWIERVRDTAFWKDYPLWLAAYETDAPNVPPPWVSWDLWQYTDRGNGNLYGAESSRIDLNYFNGDTEAFRKFFNLSSGGIQIPPTNPGDTMPFRYSFTPKFSNGSQVREDHSQSSPKSANPIPYGSYGFGDVDWIASADGSNVKKGDRWLQLKKEDGSVIGWSAEIYLGARYGTIVEINPPVVIPPDPENPPPVEVVKDVPFVLTLGDDVTYEKQTISGVVKAK